MVVVLHRPPQGPTQWVSQMPNSKGGTWISGYTTVRLDLNLRTEAKAAWKPRGGA